VLRRHRLLEGIRVQIEILLCRWVHDWYFWQVKDCVYVVCNVEEWLVKVDWKKKIKSKKDKK
jgi:hypothetical protein